MFVECPGCGARKIVLELPQLDKRYRCGECGAYFVCQRTVNAPKTETSIGDRVAGWKRMIQQSMFVGGALLFSLIVGGASIAFAEPGSILTIPIEDTFAIVPETSHEVFGLIEDVRRVVAAYERNIVSSALQSMIIMEHLTEVPSVTVPTDDMARFPSTQCPLFPEYVGKRFSQFKYTVDKDGIVTVSLSATTDTPIEEIEKLLDY
ncbi:hypothetical protein ACFLWY_02820 [Chloroflexota bacterium]